MRTSRLAPPALIAVVAGALVGAPMRPPPARAQMIDEMGAHRMAPAPAESTWAIEHVEVPGEIAFGTMAVRIWARLIRPGGSPITGASLVVGDERIPMQPLDGAFDSSAEEVVATVDTYSWVRAESRSWEIWGLGAPESPTRLASGAIRMKPRVTTPDLVLVDELGIVTPWIGSGAGGFIAGEGVSCSPPLGAPRVVAGNRDRHSDVLVSGREGVHVLKSGRSGNLTVDRLIGCGYGLSAAAFGDLDGDGGVDLVTALSPRRLEIRRDLEDIPTQSEDLELEVEHLALADLDRDGRSEIYLGLLGLEREQIVRWGPSARKVAGAPRAWERAGALSPPEGRIGRLRALVPSADGDALLALFSVDGQAVLESWGGPADIDSVDHSSAQRPRAIAGEPLGAISGRFSDAPAASWLVWVRRNDRVEWVEVPEKGQPVRRGWMDSLPAAVVALDLDGDGDDDLATGGTELRLWINVRGAAFREAGDSPYPLAAHVLALATGRLDE